MEETKKSLDYVSNWLKEGDAEHAWLPDSIKAQEYILWFKNGVEKKSDKGLMDIVICCAIVSTNAYKSQNF